MRFLTILLLCHLLYGCGGGGGSSSGSTPVTPSVRESNSTCLAPALIPNAGDYSFVRAFPSLPVLSQPMAMMQLPNDSSRWVLALRDGRLVTFANNSSTDAIATVLDIRSQVTISGEFGFTGFAFSPNYPVDNRVFVLYSDINQSGRSTLSSFDVDTQNLTASNEQILLTLEQPATNHNGGNIAFGPDGYLYAGFGDGGGDATTSQDLNNLHGSLIRIDVNQSPYRIPSDNPFNTGQARCEIGEAVGSNQCPEIYAYGFRNPWRWSFDSTTGNLWLGDVGESTFEEIDRVSAGGNYGWPIMEANSCHNSSSCDMSGLELPITQYGRSTGVSIVGGYVYRGSAIPDLGGQFIFGDTFGQSILSVPSNSSSGSAFAPLTTSGLTLGSFAQDQEGEIYALDLASSGIGDAIYRLTGGGSTIVMPENLSETGCFDTVAKTSAPGVVDYQVNSELWSDSANKARAFAIPDAADITVDADGDFIFPEGSILIKHFLADDRYLETRLMVSFPNGWRGYSYEWNGDQSEAVLLGAGKTVDAGDFVHTIPGRNQCFECHTAAANVSLGLEVVQQHYEDLSRDENFLNHLNRSYFSQVIDIGQYTPLATINDQSASIESRARSYLHSNCSGCHRPGASASFIDLRVSTPLSLTNTCNVSATLGDFGFPGAFRVEPGNAMQSTLLLRMQTLDSGLRMPPLASLIEDSEATQVVEEWINELNNCN